MHFVIQNPRLLLHPRSLPLQFIQSKYPRRCLHGAAAASATLCPPAAPVFAVPPTSEILSIRGSLLSGRRKAAEIAGEYLDRLHKVEPQIRSFLHVSETAMREAEELDRMVAGGKELPPLAGVLVGVKDNICTLDMPSTGGSKILEGYRPAFDATAVRKLREAGAIVLGKTNLDEFGMGSSTEGSGFQVTANPWDLSRVPGGSSGGSAAAVSAKQCVISLGSDTGGSVRQPASFCGVVGMKPTYGRVSRYGLMAYASSLDVIGCFGSSVADAAILLNVISGHDRLDSTSSKQEVPDFAKELVSLNNVDSKPLNGLRVGLIKETIGEGVGIGIVSVVKAAASHLEQLGCELTEISLPSFSLGLPAYYILASSEASSNLSRYDGVRYGNQVPTEELSSLYCNSRGNGFGTEVKMRILMGTYALSAGYYEAYYKRAQQVRTLIQKRFKDAMIDNDILISPAAPSAAYKIGEKTNDPLAMYAGDIMTARAKQNRGIGRLVLLSWLSRTVHRGKAACASSCVPLVQEVVQLVVCAVFALTTCLYGCEMSGRMMVAARLVVNVNLAGLPALVLPCGFVEGGSVGLPVGLQMIAGAFNEDKLFRVGHIFEQTLQNCRFVPPICE
ncbi:Glutamyl-tRNA(Gln) amidotransferase subunit A, chloroplastic/mitochondrial [Apostasia shenzhenica]|uniref:Glutamyl-tRNA(Gln) amidotransferase subunit A, chloroplastic/mitochondrial n=1 Tax=Apostasia shenzhenica TaxID=1088818 RepID=A0A2I0AY33_9ASPA|nr:Glutamyl-tRNA(Gln) amidotransferase subunit A, chloroplastic/mitochondrial [Apostasia shenzhenica]